MPGSDGVFAGQRAIQQSRPVGYRYFAKPSEPSLRVPDSVFPISLEERAKQQRALYRSLGIDTPDVQEPDKED